MASTELVHAGVKGMKWGHRKYQDTGSNSYSYGNRYLDAMGGFGNLKRSIARAKGNTLDEKKARVLKRQKAATAVGAALLTMMTLRAGSIGGPKAMAGAAALSALGMTVQLKANKRVQKRIANYEGPANG